MKDNYDFSKGKKNPYVDKLKNGYAVTVHYDFSNHQGNNTGVTDENDVTVENDAQKHA